MLQRWLFGVFIGLSGVALAEPSTDESLAEIQYLLAFVEGSSCDFMRNARWHSAVDAAAHIGKKYQYVARKGRIHSAEDFIKYAATQSSMSGKAYKVRCQGDEQASAQWLLAALEAYRRRPTPVSQ